MKKSVVLIGFPGAGKTSVGKALRDVFNRRWVDVDEVVEQAAGKNIAAIIRAEGEQRFRSLERAAVKEALANREEVISVGGGALLNEDTRREVLKDCFVVHLKVSAETASKRVRNDELEANKLGKTGVRPLLSDDTRDASEDEVRKRVEEMMRARSDLYSQAHVELDANEESPERLAEQIIQLIEKES